MATQNELSPSPGSKRRRKRVGRGLGSSQGRYAGRGSKGQKSRSGGGVSPYFEGGQLPLVKRLAAQRGFTNIFKTECSVVNVGRLGLFEPDTVIDRDKLLKKGLISSSKKPVKVLGSGDLDRSLTIRADKFSATAKKKIESVGGRAEEVGAAKAR